MSAAASAAGISSCETRAGEDEPRIAGSGGHRGGSLRAVAEEHGAKGVEPALVQLPDRVDQLDGAVPRAEGAREHRDDRARLLRERHRPAAPGVNRSVSAPHSISITRRARQPRRQDRHAWRHDESRLIQLPLAPAAHRLDDERAIQPGLAAIPGNR